MKLKKLISTLLIMTMLCTFMSGAAVFAADEITVMVDGEKVNFDQKPIIENGRTLVPVRAIFEKLGAEVSYDDKNKEVYAELGTRFVSLVIGSNEMKTNDSTMHLDVPAKIMNGRTLVPIRAISEGFGAKVSWDDATKTVYVESKQGDIYIKHKFLNYNSYYTDSSIVLKGICFYPEIKLEQENTKELNDTFKTGAMNYIRYLGDVPNRIATEEYEKSLAENTKDSYVPIEYKRTFDVSYSRGNIASFEFYTMSGYNGDYITTSKDAITYDVVQKKSLKITDVLNLSEKDVLDMKIDRFLALLNESGRTGFSDQKNVLDNAEVAGFYLNDYGVVFFLPVGTVEGLDGDTIEFEYLFEGNEDTFIVKDFKTSKDEELPPEDIKPEDTKPEDVKPEDVKPEDVKPEDTKPEDTKPEDTKPEDTKPEDTKPEDTKPEEIVNDKTYNISFADKLYAKMPADKNYMISPFSVKMALGLLANGAKGDTQREILEVMQERTINEYNEDAKYLIDVYTRIKALSYNCANSVWENTDNTGGAGFKSEYHDIIKEYYNAYAGTVTNDTAVDTINDWVENNTDKKIKELINDPDFATALVNAVYFKANWEYPFIKAATAEHDFIDRNGKMNKMDFMMVRENFNYHIDGSTTVVEIPYSAIYQENGEDRMYMSANMSMYIIMPGIESRIVNIEKYLNGISYDNGIIDLKIPKFKTSYSHDLTELLKSMGMNISFGDGADFSCMSDIKLKVDKVLQKTFINVDEDGTEAAAATVVLQKATSSLFTEDPLKVTIDRPFVYVIKDTVNNEILFMGEYAYAE